MRRDEFERFLPLLIAAALPADALACSIQFTSPGRGSTVSTPTVAVSGSASGFANTGSVGSAQATVNGSVFFNYSGTFTTFINFIGSGSATATLQPGANRLTVSGSVNGCSASDSMVVYYTPPPPPAQKNGGEPKDPNCTNPINGATGNKFQAEVDYTDPVTGLLEFRRYYNSAYTETRSLGRGWRGSYDRQLVIVGSTVHVVRADGRAFRFTRPASVWIADGDINDRLAQVVIGGVALWQFTSGDDNTTEFYDAAGRLQSIVAPNGRAVHLAYDEQGRLATVADQHGGRRLQFAYDPLGRIATLTDPAGRLLTYTYGDNLRLSAVAYPADGLPVLRQYRYNEPALTGGANLPDALTGIIDENGTRFASYSYDALGRGIGSEHGSGQRRYRLSYNADGSTTVTDPLGAARNYSYQTIQNVRRSAGQSQPPGAGCPAAASSVVYDANGNVGSRSDFNGNLTRFTYELPRNLEIRRVEADGRPEARTVSTEWHGFWRLPLRIAEPLKITRFIYNGDSVDGVTVNCAPPAAVVGTRPVAVLCRRSEQATTDANGVQAFAATPSGSPRTWNFVYDAFGQITTADGPRTDVADTVVNTYYPAGDADPGRRGNLASVTNALGQLTRIVAYDAHGRPLEVVDPNNVSTLFSYDPRGRLLSRSVDGETTRYRYDAVGQLSRVELPDGAVLNYTYDDAQRLVAIVDGLGNRIDYGLDPMGNRTLERVSDPLGELTQLRRRSYDALNRLAQLTGAANQLTEYGYDPNGNLSFVSEPLGKHQARSYDALNRLISVIDPEAGRTGYAWDGQDRLTELTDPRNLRTRYSLDGLGNRSALLSPDTGSTLYSHDAAGNVLTRQDAKGQVTATQYDALDRPLLVTHHDGSRHRYTWDVGSNGIGRIGLIEELEGDSVVAIIAYQYDSQGRVSSETRSIDGRAHTTAYQYAGARLVALIYPSGRRLDYSHDAMGRVSSITLTDGTTTSTVASGVSYRPFGGVAAWTDGAGQVHRRSFDQDGRTAGYSLGTQNWLLQYDEASRLVYQTDTANALNTGSYFYDGLDRLTAATLGSTGYAYSYDPTGNRTSHRIDATIRNYSTAADSNRLLTLDLVPGRSYVYEPDGNVASDGRNVFGYDSRGRLIRAGNAAGLTDYRVNALGERVRKSAAGGSTYFHYDSNGRLIAESDPGGNFRREYIYLGDIPVAVLQ